MDLRHSRPFRLALLFVAVSLALIGIAPYFIDAEYARNELKLALQRDTGRTLSVGGKTRVVLLPRPALTARNVGLTEADGRTRFAHADEVRIEFSLWSLLRHGEATITRLEATRPQLAVRRQANGSYNFDDLLAHRSNASPLHFDLEGVEFDDARIDFSDAASAETARLSNLSVLLDQPADPKAGRLDLAGELAVLQSGQPQWRAALEAGAALRYEAAERRLLVADLKLGLQQLGKSAPQLALTNATLEATGNLVYGWQPLRLAGGSLQLSALGTRAQQSWQWSLDAPNIDVRNDIARLTNLKLALDIRSPQSRVTAEFKLPALAGSRQGSLRADHAAIDVKVSSAEQTFVLKFASPLELQRGTIARLAGYRLTGSYANRALPRGAIPFELEGEAELDLKRETLQLTNRGTLDGAQLATLFAAEDFVDPRYRFDLDLARLDLTPYLPAVAEGARGVDAETPYDFGWLGQINANGRVQLGELIVKNLHLQQIALDFSANNGVARLDPLSAHIYGGELAGALTIDTGGRVPQFHVKQRLSGVDINPLMRDLLAIERFEGNGELALDVTASGNRISDIRGSASGQVQLALNRGAIRGIDLEAVLRATNQQLKRMSGEPVRLADLQASTHFSTLKASLAIKDGLARNDDLAVTTGLLRLSGQGEFDLGTGRIDYTMKAGTNPRVPELQQLAGLIVPVTLTGSLAAPEYRVDYGNLRQQLLQRQSRPTPQSTVGAKR
ncbi:AsmA family protein [Chitinolyticbacter meiyuanensis]|uniref:AsmA family protein n=1 Tax=Chitinolyticbacter meiyuanensis TaxID=682798 RepID=UPI0011E5E277|nr:AsmA family protein [Chitinolyticbacter meiyuanensis]